MARRKPQSDDPASSPTFEEALAGLETIVEAMENQQLPLEELVSHYEKGAELLDRCESMLQSARDRIELITLRGRGDEEAPPADPAAGDLTAAEAPNLPEDDDIRLF